MTADKTQSFSTMTTRQKATAGVVVLVVIILVWQVIGMFGGSKAPPQEASPGPKSPFGSPPQVGPNGAPVPPHQASGGAGTPQPVATVPAAPPLSQREADLLKLQQETEAKYLSALNELQILKVDREIAETNKAIATAKLDMVTAQKGIVDLLNPPAVPKGGYGQAMSGLPQGAIPAQSTAASTTETPPPAAPKEVSYTVISVSQLQYRWGAVLGYQGNLYSVHVGDILPADGSKVISIDKSGVVLEKSGEKKKISMTPII
jgi:type IV pilus biogenesis protein PilP